MRTSIPAVVSRRNNFRAAADHVDVALVRLPDQFKHQDFRKWLMTYTERVIKETASDFATAASRGIEQAATLICDPSFYEHNKVKHERATKRYKQQVAEQEWEQKRRQTCPTEEEIRQSIKYWQGQEKYYTERLAECTKHIESLRTKAPSSMAAELTKVQ